MMWISIIKQKNWKICFPGNTFVNQVNDEITGQMPPHKKKMGPTI